MRSYPFSAFASIRINLKPHHVPAHALTLDFKAFSAAQVVNGKGKAEGQEFGEVDEVGKGEIVRGMGGKGCFEHPLFERWAGCGVSLQSVARALCGCLQDAPVA